MATKKKPLSTGRISKLAANPGTRAALEDKYLSPTQLKQRQMNARLDSPIVAGSATTNRDLSHQTQSAATLQFGGDPVKQAQQLATDRTGWYQQYQDQVNKLRGDIAANNAQATTAAQGITSAVGGLGVQTAVGDGQVRGDADKASAIRQALSASFGAMQASKGQTSNDWAANLADVVVPGQKLTAQNAGAAGVKTAKDQLAAFVTKYRGDAISGETQAQADRAKMDLAYKTLGLDTSKATTQATLDAARIGETTRHNQASEANAANDPSKQKTAADLAYFKKHGYYPPTGPSKAKSKSGKGPDWLTQGEMGAGLSQLGPLKSYAQKAKTGQPFVAGHKGQGPLTRAQAVEKITANVASPKHPVLLSAALDAAYDNHLSADTVKRLIDAGYKPSQVAKTLGVMTAQKWKRRPAGRVLTEATRTISSKVPG